MVSVLSVCESNDWHSPIFEGLIQQQQLTDGRTDIQFSSAGTNVLDHDRVLKNGLTAEHLETFGIHMPPPQARRFTPERGAAADLIIDFTGYLALLIEMTPSYSTSKGKVIARESLYAYAPPDHAEKLKEHYDNLWLGGGAFQPIRRQNLQVLRDAHGYRKVRDAYLPAAVGLLAIIDGKVRPTEPELIVLQTKLGVTPAEGSTDLATPQTIKATIRNRLPDSAITTPKGQRPLGPVNTILENY